MERDGLEKGQLFPNTSPLLQRRVSWPAKARAVKVKSIGGGSQMLVFNNWASYCPLAISSSQPYLQEGKSRSRILESPIRLDVRTEAVVRRCSLMSNSSSDKLHTMTLSVMLHLSPAVASSVKGSDMI